MTRVTGSRESRRPHLPEDYGEPAGAALQEAEGIPQGTLAEIMNELERKLLQAAIERFDGHRGHMADSLGITPRNLWEILLAHGLS